MKVWVGTSGWQYASWRGTFYPARLPQAAWLAHYVTKFPIVEVNNTFYRMPEPTFIERWRGVAPPGFVFAVKANQLITHRHRLRGAEEALSLFWSRVLGLGDKLGPVLFQTPPSLRVDLPRLTAFLRTLPPGMRAAFELRDASWSRSDVLRALDRAGAAWVLADHNGVSGPTFVTGGFAYVRFHQGRPDRPGYARETLERWADRIVSLGVETFTFFNNDVEVAAPGDALTLTSLLRERGCDVVPPRATELVPAASQLGLPFRESPAPRGSGSGGPVSEKHT